MARIVQFADVKHNSNTVLTVGSFDGVHLGHRSLIDRVREKAEEIGARSMIVTFEPHPREIINPGSSGIKYLTTMEERAKALNGLGIDEMVVIPFDRDFSLLSSREFIEKLHSKIGLKVFVTGFDHQFGKDRSGGTDTLQSVGDELDFDVSVVEKQQMLDQKISSTRIRKLLSEEGDVEMVREMLDRPYEVYGRVVHGEGRGHKLGYPTANVVPVHPKKIIPKVGVYVADCEIDGNKHRAMVNIGFKPTFGGEYGQAIEAHIFNFSEDIYGKALNIEFLKRIRDEKRFNGAQELIDQLNRDKVIALEYQKV